MAHHRSGLPLLVQATTMIAAVVAIVERLVGAGVFLYTPLYLTCRYPSQYMQFSYLQAGCDDDEYSLVFIQ
jgi:hypothetical protein